MPISDQMVEGGPVLGPENFDTGTGWSLDTTENIDGGVIGGSTDYQARDGQLKAGYYDAGVQSYATRESRNNNQVNGEQACSMAPGAALGHLTPFSVRPNSEDSGAQPELVITCRPPTEAEQPDAHFHGYYVQEDGTSARASYFTAENGFPNGIPQEWEPNNTPTDGSDPQMLFSKCPSNYIGGHLSTRLRYSAAFFEVKVVASIPTGARDRANTPPRVRGETYDNGKSATDFFNPTDLGASHRDVDAQFPAIGWTLEEGEAGEDMNGNFQEGSARQETPGNIALSGSRAELDTMEGFGFSDTSVWQTAHFFDYKENSNRKGVTNAKLSQSPAFQVNSLRDFHEYKLHVTPEKIGFAVDGVYTFVIETPRPFSVPRGKFVPRPGASFKPNADNIGNGEQVRGEFVTYEDGSPRYPKHFVICNLVDAAKFIRSFAFNSLTHPDQSKRDSVPEYKEVDEVVIREWSMSPLAVDNPDSFSSARKGVLQPTVNRVSSDPRPPPQVCQAFLEDNRTVTVYGIATASTITSMNVYKNNVLVATLNSSPFIWVDDSWTATSRYHVIGEDSAGTQSSRSPIITVPFSEADPDAPTVDRPPRVLVPDQRTDVETGRFVDVSISVSDEDQSSVVVTASASASSIARVASATAQSVRVEGLSPGVSDIAVTATDASGQSATESFEIRVVSVQTGGGGGEPDPPVAGGGDPVPPVSDVVAATRPDGIVRVSWSAPSDTSGVTGYRVTLAGYPEITTQALTHDFTGVVDGEGRRAEVFALGPNGTASASRSATVQDGGGTRPVDPDPPPQPDPDPDPDTPTGGGGSRPNIPPSTRVNSYRRVATRDDGGALLLPSSDAPSGSTAPSQPPPPADGGTRPSNGSTVLASSTRSFNTQAPEEGVLPTNPPLPDGSSLATGSEELRWYLDFDVVWRWTGAGWAEVARRAGSSRAAGDYEIRQRDANGLNRNSPSYSQLVDTVPVSESDVTAGVHLLIRGLAPDDRGATTDWYIASTVSGNPSWRRFV